MPFFLCCIRKNTAMSLHDDTDLDRWEAYEEEFDAPRRSRHGPRKDGQSAKQARAQAARKREEMVEASGLEAGFVTTYQPARFEAEWLLSSLRSFYDQELITDVLANVKGGKEASVYLCAGHPTTGHELLAAKVYRPRQFRSLRNDAMYKEGRAVLTADGRPVKETDHRTMRAIGKKTGFGVQVAHTSWLMYEFTSLERLRQAGAAVPQAVAVNDNALLMSYCGDAGMAAPVLQRVQLDRDEATRLFNEVLWNIEIMLQLGLIHGDLSAYNILYWEGNITLIDFPQVTNASGNRNARAILRRDVTRVCDYFASQGVPGDADMITDELWRRYVALHPDDQAADESVIVFQSTADEDF
jgi:RIO kinase 1